MSEVEELRALVAEMKASMNHLAAKVSLLGAKITDLESQSAHRDEERHNRVMGDADRMSRSHPDMMETCERLLAAGAPRAKAIELRALACYVHRAETLRVRNVETNGGMLPSWE